MLEKIPQPKEMGCTYSSYGFGRNKSSSRINEVVVFVPSIRIPVQSDLQRGLREIVPQDLVATLSSLRNQIILVAEDTGGSAIAELQQTLNEYLSVLIGLTKKEFSLEGLIEFKWKNFEEGRQDSCAANPWFEVISVVHLMAMLTLSEADSMMIPKDLSGSGIRVVSSDSKREAVDLLLKASGYLEFCIKDGISQMPPEIKKILPHDLQEGVLNALSIQALGQAAAYYYHGLMVDKGNEPTSHICAISCFLAAEELLGESKKACFSFCLAAPVTRAPPLWGVMKHLHQKIPEVAARKSQMYGYLLEQEKGLQALPELPEFQLSLSPDDYELSEVNSEWNTKNWESLEQPLKEQLKDSEDEIPT